MIWRCASTLLTPGSPIKFNCVQEVFRNKDTDFKLAKGAFFVVLFAELKDVCTAEATWAINEAETLAVEQEGLVVVT